MWREGWKDVPKTPTKERAALLGETVMQGRPLLLKVDEVPAAIVFIPSETSGLEDVAPLALPGGWYREDLLYALAILAEHWAVGIDYSGITEALIDGASFVDFHGHRVVYRITGGVGERSTHQPVSAVR